MQIDPAQWPAFSRLMDQMLDLPAPDRVEWVRGLTGAEAQLAPQLLTLLQTAGDTRRTAWMDTLPKMDEAAIYTLVQSGIGYEDVGDEVGPYRLVRLIARGGMGSVWYAERSDRLMRRGVALKLPLGNSRQLAARFDREREIVAGLVHPHIARLYDAGVAESGQAYLALEYVEGQNLDQYCDRRQLGLRARIELFAQVLSAVQYAHSRLVIHRDIKPTNILVTNEGEVRLLDFGVAKLLDTETPEASELTQMGDAGMTLAYASPEQVAGRPVTTATDVYSLGVVLYELLVGTRPYRARRDSRGALEEAILQADIPLPSALVGVQEDAAEAAAARAGTVRKLRKELQGDLDAILIKALSRKPQDRYETVAGFADDLERYRNGRAVRAHRRSRWYQARKFVARNRVGVGAAVLATVSLSVATGVALMQAREARHQAQLAAGQRDRAVAAEANREAVDEFLSDLLLDAGRTGKPLSVTALIARADELSAREFANEPEVRAAVLRTVGTLELEFVGPEKALANFEQGEKLLAGSHDDGLRAGLACDRALLRGALGRADEVRQTFDAVVADPRTPVSAASQCLGDKAQLANYTGDGAVGAQASAQALALWDEVPAHSPLRRLELVTVAAQADFLNGEPAKADAAFAQVTKELTRIGRERGELANSVRNQRILAAISSGDPGLALNLIDDSIKRFREDAPDRSPPLLSIYDRSVALADLGRYHDALAGLTAVAELKEAQAGQVAQRALLDAAVCLARLGRQSDAESTYRRALLAPGGRSSVPEADNDTRVSRLLSRAELDLAANAFRAARAELDAALKLNLTSATLASVYRLRSEAVLRTGDMDMALQDSLKSLELSRKLQGDKAYSRPAGLAYLRAGQAWQAKGDVSQARQSFAAAVENLSHTVEPGHPDLILATQSLKRT